jgi:PAS domain S-box-containing protein
MVSQAAQNVLSGGRGAAGLSDLRRLVMYAAATNRLDVCRVVLPDGTTLVDSGGEGAGSMKGPEAWPSGRAPEESYSEEGGVLRAVVPFVVSGAGEAAVEVSGTVGGAGAMGGTAEIGAGLIGIGGLVGLMVAYRAVGGRLRALWAIHEALMSVPLGDRSAGALSVSPEFGAEARAWNELLDQRELSQMQKAGELAGDRRRVSGEDSTGVLDAMWMGILLLDESLRITYANGAAAVVLQAKREELIGQDAFSVLSSPEAAKPLEALRSGEARHRTTFELAKIGEAGGVLKVSLKPCRKGDSTAAVVMIEDVTQQRVAENSRNTLVAQAAHELRTPLTNIRLYVEALLEGEDGDAQVRAKAINTINQESIRLERIVSDMLCVAEMETGSMRIRRDDIRFEDVIESLRRDFAAQATDKEIELSFDLPPKMPVVCGDRDKVVLAIQNLLGNALKYTPAGGKVTVRVSTSGNGTTPDAVSVEVTDTGIGIREDEQEMVFERFYRAKDRRIAGITGTGLGLTLARQIARAHGGDITLRSKVDQGSTFTLVLPAAAGGSRAMAA